MNKKLNQRPRVNKHWPKVFDDNQPKKIPKAQTLWGLTPRPKPSKPISPFRVHEKMQSEKNKYTGSTSNRHEDAAQKKKSNPHEDVVQDAQAASTLQVYRRSFRENQCLQNSKKCGPVFPKILEKRRTLRRSITLDWWYKNGNVRSSHRKVHNKFYKSKDKNRMVKHDLYTKEWDLRVFSPPSRKRSVMHAHPYFKRTPYNNKKFFLCQKENVLQNEECLPLHRDFQQFDNSDGNLNCRQLHEVPVLGNQSLVPRHAKNSLTKKDLYNLYVREMMKYLIKKMEKLDMNGQCKELVVRDNDSGALVKIVPKKRKVLSKVDLDKETLRVWKLLMVKDGSEPLEEWWERQGDEFSFIAKM